MGLEPFGAGQRGDGGREAGQCRGGQFPHGDDFHEIGDGETSTDACRAAGGEDVIGAGAVVTGGFGAVRADEDAAGVADRGEQRGVGGAL